MEKIYIIGASGFAKEVCNLIITENLYEVAGFIDFEPTVGNIIIGNKSIPVIKESGFLEHKKNGCNLAIGIGNSEIIATIFDKFKEFNFPNIISKYAIVGLDVYFGKGNIVTQNVVFTTNINVGDGNIFNLSSTIGHDCIIGNFNVINPSVNISGGVNIGSNNLLGVGSIILQYLNVGNKNIIGGSALVVKNIEDSKLIIGIPGKEK